MKTLIHLLAAPVLMAGAITSSQAGEKHLFYLHGCCLNKVGSGTYQLIAEELRKSGFNVKFELRYDDSNSEIDASAAKVAGQVKELIARGTPPEDITVSGYSLGSVITLYASMAIAHPRVNYVLLAGCPGPGARAFDIDYNKVQGRVLSIVDTQDNRFGSCKKNLPETVLQEVSFDSGYGHSIFQYTNESSLKLWKTPLENWANGKGI